MVSTLSNSPSHIYDKAAIHFLTGGFPENLPIEQAHVHIGMYLGWIIDHKLYSEYFEEECETQIFRFKRREISPALFSEMWSGYLASEIFDETGNMFTYYYYGGGLYKSDYHKVLAHDLPSIYHVKDSWENYEFISHKMNSRFEIWKAETSL